VGVGAGIPILWFTAARTPFDTAQGFTAFGSIYIRSKAKPPIAIKIDIL